MGVELNEGKPWLRYVAPAELTDASGRIAESLSALAYGVTELRNGYGTGHGRDAQAKPLTARHARLAVTAAVAMVTFLLEGE